MTTIQSHPNAHQAGAYQKARPSAATASVTTAAAATGACAGNTGTPGGEAGPVAALADSAVSFVSDTAKALYQSSISEAQQIQAAAVSAYDSVTHGVTALGDYASDLETRIEQAVDAVTGSVGNAVNAVESGVGSVVNGIDDAAGAIAAYAVDGAKTVGQYLNVIG